MINWIKTKIASAYNWTKSKIKGILVALGIIGIALAVSAPPPPIDTSFQNLEKVEKIGEKFKIKVNEDPTEEMSIEIGGDMADFMPTAKLKKWGDETFIKIKYPTDKKIKPEQKDGKLEWKDKDIEVHFETTEDAFKYIPVLKKKPATNVIELEIESKGLEFYYQPELTQKEIDDGCVRPEHIVGSWAVYHSTQAGDYSQMDGKNYRAGKFGHIYRPRLKDNNGWEIWGDLFIDAENGIYRITIPTDFYENAVYPIKSNDTFGHTGIGGSIWSKINDRVWQGRFAPTGGDGNGDSITVYLDNTGNAVNAKCNVYDDGDGYTDLTTNLLANGTTEELSVASSFLDWKTFNFNSAPSFTNGVYYRLAAFGDTGTNDLETYYDSVAGNYIYGSLETYPTWPDPVTSTKYEDYKYSIYCTYTAGEAEEEEEEDYLIIFD